MTSLTNYDVIPDQRRHWPIMTSSPTNDVTILWRQHPQLRTLIWSPSNIYCTPHLLHILVLFYLVHISSLPPSKKNISAPTPPNSNFWCYVIIIFVQNSKNLTLDFEQSIHQAPGTPNFQAWKKTKNSHGLFSAQNQKTKKLSRFYLVLPIDYPLIGLSSEISAQLEIDKRNTENWMVWSQSPATN